MFVAMGVALALGLILTSFVIYSKKVVVESQADHQLERLQAFSCEEIVKFHSTVHYFSSENKGYASNKVETCNKAKNDV